MGTVACGLKLKTLRGVSGDVATGNGDVAIENFLYRIRSQPTSRSDPVIVLGIATGDSCKSRVPGQVVLPCVARHPLRSVREHLLPPPRTVPAIEKNDRGRMTSSRQFVDYVASDESSDLIGFHPGCLQIRLPDNRWNPFLFGSMMFGKLTTESETTNRSPCLV